MFLALGQARSLQFQALQRLAGRVVLGTQRPQAHRQLVSVVLVLAGLLTHPVKAFAQGVAAGHQLFALLGVLGHELQSLLQQQACFAQLLVFQGALLFQLAQLFVQAAAAQLDLLGARAAGRKTGLQLAVQAVFILCAAAQLFALLLQVSCCSRRACNC